MKKLPCGHPHKKFNLIDGECGTCKIARDLEKLALDTGTPKLKKDCLRLADMFKNGTIVYDCLNGKTLFEHCLAYQST